MFCNECGAEINDNAVVCTKCGVAVKGRQLPGTGVEQVPNHMVGAILTTLFCCLIGGIIAIIYSSQVNSKLAMGDIEGAKAASKTAKTWIIVNLCVGLAIALIYLLVGVVAAAL